MGFRFIKGQRGACPLAEAAKASRAFGLGALVCAVLGTSAFSQATLDFIDPLDTERTRIEERGEAPARATAPPPRATEARDLPPPRLGSVPERNSESVLTRARDGAASGAETVRDGASGFWGTLRAALSAIAAALGLPTLALVALLGLLIAGLASLVGWTLFRGRRRRRVEETREDVYARSSKDAAKRRAIATTTAPKPAIVKKKPAFEETMPEDFDAIFSDERAEPAPRRELAEKTDDKGWRKPNLDRLRDSIKADWKADKAEKAERSNARPPKARASVAAATAASARQADPDMRTLDDLSDGWEEWDSQDKPEDDPWGETLPVSQAPQKDDDDTAADRIRALRESLRAS